MDSVGTEIPLHLDARSASAGHGRRAGYSRRLLLHPGRLAIFVLVGVVLGPAFDRLSMRKIPQLDVFEHEATQVSAAPLSPAHYGVCRAPREWLHARFRRAWGLPAWSGNGLAADEAKLANVAVLPGSAATPGVETHLPATRFGKLQLNAGQRAVS